MIFPGSLTPSASWGGGAGPHTKRLRAAGPRSTDRTLASRSRRSLGSMVPGSTPLGLKLSRNSWSLRLGAAGRVAEYFTTGACSGIADRRADGRGEEAPEDPGAKFV